MMAKANPKKASRMGRPPRETPTTVLGIRGSFEWWKWVATLARRKRVDVTKLFDIAVTELGKSEGLPDPPDRL
jgi:hypothetical protein